MSRVLLLNPPSEKNYIRSGRWTRKSRANQQWHPIWCAYATALLEREGHEAFLVDSPADNRSYQQVIQLVEELKPDYIAYYFGYDTLGKDIHFADSLQQLSQVVLVGPWSFCINALEFSKSVNLMTYGEFEHTLLEVVDGNDPSKIKGLIWRKDTKSPYITNERRPLCSSEELDRIPFVTRIYRRFLKIENYRQTALEYPFVDTQSSRGCAHRCIYCVQTRAMQGGPNYRARSIKNVIDELHYIETAMPKVKMVFFQDEAIIPKRAKELSAAILDASIKLHWGGLSRADLDLETLQLMSDSGCRVLHVGYEKPIQKTLDIIHKDITVERYEQFCQDIRKTKIWNHAAFMIFPWETPEDIRFTLKWAKKTRPNRLNFIAAQPYPNTPYAEYVASLEKENVPLMTTKEMHRWEVWAHKQYYIYHPWMWWQLLKHPLNWKKVATEAIGLISSFGEE